MSEHTYKEKREAVERLTNKLQAEPQNQGKTREELKETVIKIANRHDRRNSG